MRKREEEGMDWIFRASCRKLNYLAHPRGAWASPGLCKEQFGTVYGGFQSSLVTSDWVSFDHLLLEAKPRTVIFWSDLTPNTGQDPDSCKNWQGAGRRRDLPETRLGKQAGGSHFDRFWRGWPISCRAMGGSKLWNCLGTSPVPFTFNKHKMHADYLPSITKFEALNCLQ